MVSKLSCARLIATAEVFMMGLIFAKDDRALDRHSCEFHWWTANGNTGDSDGRSNGKAGKVAAHGPEKSLRG